MIVRLSLQWLTGSEPGYNDILAFVVTPENNRIALGPHRVLFTNISIFFRNELLWKQHDYVALNRFMKRWNGKSVHLRFKGDIWNTGYISGDCSLMLDRHLQDLKQESVRYWAKVKGVQYPGERARRDQRRRKFHVGFC